MVKILPLPVLANPQPLLETGGLPSFTVTPSAQEKIKSVLNKDQLVRVSIEGGGCTGMRYRFDVVEKTNTDPDDLVYAEECLVVDPISLNYIQGATLDYINDLTSSYFSFKNPNATAHCGCGSSFAV